MKKKTAKRTIKKTPRTKKVLRAIERTMQILDTAAKQYVAHEQAGRAEIVAIGSDFKKHWKRIGSI